MLNCMYLQASPCSNGSQSCMTISLPCIAIFQMCTVSQCQYHKVHDQQFLSTVTSVFMKINPFHKNYITFQKSLNHAFFFVISSTQFILTYAQKQGYQLSCMVHVKMFPWNKVIFLFSFFLTPLIPKTLQNAKTLILA